MITVCDNAREKCPAFPGNPRSIHWSLRDPTTVVGSEDAQYDAFEQTARQIEARIRHLLAQIERERSELGG